MDPQIAALLPMLAHMLSKDPKKRPAISGIRNHLVKLKGLKPPPMPAGLGRGFGNGLQPSSPLGNQSFTTLRSPPQTGPQVLNPLEVESPGSKASSPKS